MTPFEAAATALAVDALNGIPWAVEMRRNNPIMYRTILAAATAGAAHVLQEEEVPVGPLPRFGQMV